MFRILIPQAFENMEEATIGSWLRQEGDAVQPGEALCELITEKTTFDLPAEECGTLVKIVAAEKSVVPVGYIIGLIGAPGAAAPDVSIENAALLQRRQQAAGKAAAETTQPAVRVPASNAQTTASTAPSVQTGGSRIRATPAARRAARERNIPIEHVAAANPGKVVSEEDVLRF
jgi:pyruvate dehydrogenase E2 component (dihydrolipoamide acetyltransferase)